MNLVLKILPTLLAILVLKPYISDAQPGRVQEGASQAIGLRFGTHWNYFTNTDVNPMVDHYHSHTAFGLTYKFYGQRGHAELGTSVGFKGDGDSGLNFPVVAQDYRDDYNTSLSLWQVDFKVGPRLWGFVYPKFGLIYAYRWRADNLIDPDKPNADDQTFINSYIAIPMGFSLDFPTSFGTTGFGFFWEVGLMQSIRDFPENTYRNAFNVEIHVALRTKD